MIGADPSVSDWLQALKKGLAQTFPVQGIEQGLAGLDLVQPQSLDLGHLAELVDIDVFPDR